MDTTARLEAIRRKKEEFEERMRKQRAQLDARIKQEEAKVTTAQRKRDTRRKVLLGAMLNAWIAEDADMQSKVEKRLADFLEKRIDFEVFGMPVPADVASREADKEAKKAAKAEAKSAA